jgi:hypothetical protein
VFSSTHVLVSQAVDWHLMVRHPFSHFFMNGNTGVLGPDFREAQTLPKGASLLLRSLKSSSALWANVASSAIYVHAMMHL